MAAKYFTEGYENHRKVLLQATWSNHFVTYFLVKGA